MNVLLGIIISMVVFFFMEFMAWATHKFVMHGFLWVLHKDHHIRDGRKVEWNDVFALMFALPSAWLIFSGSQAGADYKLYIGIGIALYGIAYFLMHDAFVHQRIRLSQQTRNPYLRATLKAHQDHHGQHFHSNFGFLLAPWRYYKEAYRGKK